MLNALREGRVAGLRVTVACARSLDEVPDDVYLLDVAPPDPTAGGGRFDEVPYLEVLEPVLEAAGDRPPWAVEVSRTHRSDHDGVGRARLSVLLGLGTAPASGGPSPDLTAVVRSAFERMAAAPAGAAALSRGEALAAATAAVADAFPAVDVRALSLTDEEHHAVEGRWSLSLAVPGVVRFQVHLGLVPAAPASVHLRRMPVGEVVDSVGT
ncbi:MAG TPA: hypothetical protein VFJ97_00690 [Dermatophilaceae bacterium]|nr:hypothetical protein [Dermatophilaceae bacterium]